LQEFDRLSRRGQKVRLRRRVFDRLQLAVDLGELGLPCRATFAPEALVDLPEELVFVGLVSRSRPILSGVDKRP
jgi:hypothetical protein